MTQIDMKQSQYKVQSNIFKHKTIGDYVQGTLVGKRVVPNRLKQGEDQFAYDLKTADGVVVTVFGKPGIDFQMRTVKLGQIIGMEYVKDIPPKVSGYDPTRIIQVYADPKMVDEEWVNEQEEGANTIESFKEPQGFMNTPAPTPPVSAPRGTPEVAKFPASHLTAAPQVNNELPFESAPANTAAEKLEMIKTLAKKAIPGVDDNNYLNKVMEITGVPCTIPNYDKIITMLKS